MILRLR